MRIGIVANESSADLLGADLMRAIRKRHPEVCFEGIGGDRMCDAGFRRHVESERVDRQVLGWLQEQFFANQELITEGILSMLGKDDLFTKAMIDASMQNMDQLIEHGLPDDARTWLGMFGFRIIVDIHGDVVRTELPAQEAPDEF